MSHSSCHYVQTYGPRCGGRRPEDWTGQRSPGRWPSRRGDVHEEDPEVPAGGGGGQRGDRRPGSVQQTIGAKLQQDASIANVVALGADIALAAQKAKADAGSQADIATFDLNADVAKQIKDGGILFSVDQQPYVQGYMAVTSLWLNLTNGNDIGGGGPVLTGPSGVHQTTIDKIIPYTKNNTR